MLKGKGYNEMNDIFSLGCIIYFMLAGRHLFKGKNSDEVLYKNRECKIFEYIHTLPVSRSCKSFLYELLREDPTMRITHEDALQHKWLL